MPTAGGISSIFDGIGRSRIVAVVVFVVHWPKLGMDLGDLGVDGGDALWQHCTMSSEMGGGQERMGVKELLGR